MYKLIKAYRDLISHTNVHPLSCQYKHKVFFWLLLRDRFTTRELNKRKNMGFPSYDCVLCTQPKEKP